MPARAGISVGAEKLILQPYLASINIEPNKRASKDMKDHEFRSLVGDLCKIATEFHTHQSLRIRMADALKMALAQTAQQAIQPDDQNQELFYLQDSRSLVGNDMLWWAKDGKGYTSNLGGAHQYTREEALAQHNMRPTDIPWLKGYIDARARPAVDMQNVKLQEAAAMAGLMLTKAQKTKRETHRCEGCKRFLSVAQLYGQNCPHCGVDNRP